MNTYLKYQPPAVQFFTFLSLAAGFFLVDYAISSIFFNDVSAVILNKNMPAAEDLIPRFKLNQLISTVVAFILPAFFFAYFSSPGALPYVGIQKNVHPVLLVSSIILLACIYPFINWLGELNTRINFGKMQHSVRQMEEVYNRVLQVFLKMPSFSDLLVNLLIMALLPAIAEELFFRGALQKTLLRLSNKPWLAIITSAAVFGLLHGTFLKLLPILALGILLGTIYYITSNLWYCITIHFINNAFAVLSVYYGNRSETLKKLADDNINVPVYGALVSLVIAIGILYYMRRKSEEVLPEIIRNDDNDYIA